MYYMSQVRNLDLGHAPPSCKESIVVYFPVPTSLHRTAGHLHVKGYCTPHRMEVMSPEWQQPEWERNVKNAKGGRFRRVPGQTGEKVRRENEGGPRRKGLTRAVMRGAW